jgi:hypothetical protein
MLRILSALFVLISLHILQVNASAYEKNNSACFNHLSDSSKESVILEYDTIHLPPDTIRLTDTIIIAENNTRKNIGEKLPKFTNKTNKSLGLNKQSKYSLSICFAPFITAHNFYSGNLGDSVKFPANQPLNFYYEISSGLRFKNWVLFSGINFISFSEISEKQQYESRYETIGAGLDTTVNLLKVLSSRQIKNYYYYAGFLFGAAYNWEKHKFIFCPQACLGFSRRLPNMVYKFDKGINVISISADEQPDYLLSFSLSSAFAYKINKKVLILLLPTYVYNVLGKNNFPITYRYNFRLAIGMGFEL